MRLQTKRSESGLWFAYSDDVRGLLAVGHSEREALERVPEAVRELAEVAVEMRIKALPA